MSRRFLISVTLLFLLACAKRENHGINAGNMDTAVDPAMDFYMYANGGWLKRNEIPASESSWPSAV